MQDKKFFVTTPLYYVNDKPHLGHFYTTLLADVLARYKTEQGFNVLFSTGTDEHGDKIAEAAEQAKVSTQELTDKISKEFKQNWNNLDIKYSDFIRTTEKRHKKAVEHFLQQLKDKNFLYEGIYEGLYCKGCEKFIQESDLNEQGLCVDHNKLPQQLKEKNWFFKLSAFEKKLIKLIETDKLKIEPVGRKKEALGFLGQGLKDISISREGVEWGIPLPWDKNQITYVWIEALINYITVLGYPWDSKFQVSSFKIQDFWPTDLQLMAKDIIKFHAIIWPAMLIAAELEIPKRIFAHGFFTIEGKKMSKTLGNVIAPQELVNKFGVDGARYVVLAEISTDKDTDISWKKLEERYNADLKNNIGNLFSRLTVLAQKNNIKSFVIASSSVISVKKLNNEAIPSIDQITQNFNTLIKQINISGAIIEVQKLLNFINSYLDKEKPWQENNEQKIKTVLSNSFNILYTSAKLLQPIMPTKMSKILKIKQGDKLVVPEKNIHLF